MPHYTQMERGWVEMHEHGRGHRNQVPSTAPLADLIRHLDKVYDRRALQEDLDSVLSCCESPADRLAVKRYARDRLNPSPARAIHCEECGHAFDRTRSDARFCGATCRQRSKRRRELGQLTDKPTFNQLTASQNPVPVPGDPPPDYPRHRALQSRERDAKRRL